MGRCDAGHGHCSLRTDRGLLGSQRHCNVHSTCGIVVCPVARQHFRRLLHYPGTYPCHSEVAPTVSEEDGTCGNFLHRSCVSIEVCSIFIVLALTGISSACIISIIRLYSLKIAGNSTDPDWDYVDAAIWSIAELNISIMCASLPTLRPLIMRVFPFFLEPSTRKESYLMTSSTDGTKQSSRHATRRGPGESTENLQKRMADLENQREYP